MSLQVIKHCANVEISTRIFGQASHLFLDKILSGNEKEQFVDQMITTIHKLSATRYHLDNYIRIENNQFKNIRKRIKKDPNVPISEAFELIFELEGFLFQIKSSLDMLVKMIEPIIGKGLVKTKTFGNKGDQLIKGLEQYKKKNGVDFEKIDNLINLVKSDQDTWLKKTIEVRDLFNHTKGLKNYQFRPVKLKNGEIILKKPQLSQRETIDDLELIYSNNLEFHQDFLAFILALKVPFKLMKEDPKRIIGDFGEKDAKYIKWCFKTI